MFEKVGNIEYLMSEAVAEDYLKTRKGEDKKLQPQDYLIKVVNEEYGLMYNCTKVTIM